VFGINLITIVGQPLLILLATDENLVYVSNPNGLENSSKSSGWYSFDEVLPWVAKALFVESN
jgi:hypothetical protein